MRERVTKRVAVLATVVAIATALAMAATATSSLDRSLASNAQTWQDSPQDGEEDLAPGSPVSQCRATTTAASPSESTSRASRP